jgi:hypothetical protein
MSHPKILACTLASLAALAVTAPAASADTLLAPAPGGQNLAAGGGWLAWSAPAEGGGFKLVLRAPDGTVSEPTISRFGAPADPAIGSDRYAADGRRLLVVYSRCSGASATAGCDVYALNLATGAEEPVRPLASRLYSETAPSISSGAFTFVRRNAGRRQGVWYYRPGHSPRQVSRTLARETAFNGSRVAYSYNSSKGGGVIVRRVSGEGGALTATARNEEVPRSIGITRYQATWLLGSRPWYTTRFGGSGGPHTPQTKQSARTLPATTSSLAIGATTLSAWYLDAEGVKTAVPNPFKP